MTAVGFRESTRYALRLYSYVLATFVLGAGGVVLGAVLLWPEIRAWRGPGAAAAAPGLAGAVVLFLGLSVLVTGWLATTYKLLADGVAAGRETPTTTVGPDSPTDEPTTTDDGVAGRPAADDPPEPSPSEIAFGDDGADATDALPGDGSAGDPLDDRSA
jgi:hypothetical protein